MDTDSAKALWETVGKGVVVGVLTILLILFWHSMKFGDQIAWVSTPEAVQSLDTSEKEYLDIMHRVLPTNPVPDEGLLTLGYMWCDLQAQGVSPLDQIALTYEQEGPAAADIAANVIAAAPLYLCEEGV